MKDVLVVGVGVMGRPYLTAADRLGCGVRAVDIVAGDGAVPDPPGVRYYPVDDGLEESWLLGASRAVAERVPDGIVAFAEPQVLAGALLQDRFGLPGPSLSAAVISRNKALQRNVCAAAGLPQPGFRLTGELTQARSWMLEHLPVVVKPLTLSGSEGVELVADERAVEEVLGRRAGEGKLLVEEAVDGPEFSWEGLVHDGTVRFGNITAKETTAAPYFVELCHRCGHRFDPSTAGQVDELVRGVLAAIGMRTGLVHLEFRLAQSGPVLMEVAVRTPGDYLADAVGLAYELDLYEAVLRLALDLPLDGLADRQLRAHPATMFVTAPPGRITGIEGVDEVGAHPAVVRVRLRKGTGDQVAPLTSSDQRLGHVLINAATPAEREEALGFVRDRLRVTVDDSDGQWAA